MILVGAAIAEPGPTRVSLRITMPMDQWNTVVEALDAVPLSTTGPTVWDLANAIRRVLGKARAMVYEEIVP